MAIVVTGIAICFLIGQSLSFEIFQITGKGRHLSFLNLFYPFVNFLTHVIKFLWQP